MPKLPTLERIREKIRGQVMAENLAKKSNGDTKPLFNAMAMVPEADMWRLVQWLHEVILPKVLLHRGEDSAEYKNYVGIRDAVIWSMYIGNIYERQLLQTGHLQLDNGLLRERLVLCERELQKFTAMDAIYNADAVALYRDTLVQRALKLLAEKPASPIKTSNG